MGMLSREALLAIDDGYFPPHYKSLKGYTPVVGVAGYRSYIYGIALRFLLVDSMDIEGIFLDIYREISGSVDLSMISIVSDNVVYGGFSVYDPWYISEELGKPVVVVFSHQLDLDRIRKALRKHFIDHSERYSVIDRSYRSSRAIVTPRGAVRILCIGLDWGRCVEIIIDNQTFHPVPQPLKHADLIASAIGRLISSRSSPS